MQILINDDLLPVGDSCNLTWAVDRKPDVLKDFVALSEEIFTPPDTTQCTHINQRFISTLPITFLVNHYQNIVSVWMGINETVFASQMSFLPSSHRCQSTEGTQSTNPKDWPDLILSLSTTRLSTDVSAVSHLMGNSQFSQ